MRARGAGQVVYLRSSKRRSKRNKKRVRERMVEDGGGWRMVVERGVSNGWCVL